MATFVVVLFCYSLLFQVFPTTQASTHWVVTEDGRIQSQYDSIFSLHRPYDLVALLKQEERAVMLEHLREELLSRKDEIDKNEDKDTGLEQRFYKTDSDCILAGKPLPDFDLYISTVLPLENKGIRPEEHIDFKAPPTAEPQSPYCTDFIDIDFSIHAFEHLMGMKDRFNLSGTPELGLKNAITHRDNVDDYGHLIYEALQKNNTSWVLYNMAAFYWRIKGDTYHVIECLRRALHYSPRMQKDVALISLANVLHRSRYSNEAAVVVHAALDVSKELNVNHFTLGNIYAVLAEYNKSVICFENTLKIQPDFEAAAKRKHAVLCHAKLESALEAQHRSLQRTLNELRDYQRKHEYWQTQQEKMLTEQASVDMKLDQRIQYESQKIRENGIRNGEFCHMVGQNGKQVLECGWGRRHPVNDWDMGYPPTNPKPGGEEPVRLGANSMDYSKPLKAPMYTQRATLTPEATNQLAYKTKDWPTKEECDTYVQKFPAWNEFPTTYLPPENKGFEVKALLAEAQGLKEGKQHPLPWYPPVCVSLADIPEGDRSYDHIQSVKERNKIPPRLVDISMKPLLLKMVDSPEMTEEEVGQRILSALKKKIGPSWVLYNLAGLYWRINGNNYHGIECIRRALYSVPPEFKDVPLVNLANILYKWGRVDDAVTVMRDAIAINDFEPETHFFLGNMLSAKVNMSGAIWHYEEALNQNPRHTEAYNTLRNVKCYQKFHRSAQSEAKVNLASNTVNCQKGEQAQLKQPTVESRVVCKNENGGETCVVERPLTHLHCEGACKQTCTVTPIKLESCPNTGNTNTCHNGSPVNPICVNTANGNTAKSDVVESQCGNQQENSLIVDPNFNARLDEVSEYYRQKGICAGDECHHLMVECMTPMPTETGYIQAVTRQHFTFKSNNMCQQCMNPHGQRPHTRLEIVNGILHQKLIFVESPSDIIVNPADCVIFNDGSKSEGCTREEYKPYEEHSYWWLTDLDLEDDLDDMLMDLQSPKQNTDTPKESDTHGNQDKSSKSEAVKPSTPTTTDDKSKPDNKKRNNRKESSRDSTKVNNYRRSSKLTPKFNDERIAKIKPDPVNNIVEQQSLPWPSWDECQNTYRQFNFKQFMSTWVSVTTKDINIADHVDFEEHIRGELQEPECDPRYGGRAKAISLITAVTEVHRLPYQSELGLKDLLQKMGGGEAEPVGVVGTRIAKALHKNPQSWVLTNLAALYWRVEGDAVKAIDCIKVAYSHCPEDAKDIALLSLANVLHKSNRVQDAITVTHMALNASPSLVAGHFTMANLYAAKGDWSRATQFYEATLAFQYNFMPARERLHNIQCDKVLSNPHMYRNKGNS